MNSLFGEYGESTQMNVLTSIIDEKIIDYESTNTLGCIIISDAYKSGQKNNSQHYYHYTLGNKYNIGDGSNNYCCIASYKYNNFSKQNEFTTLYIDIFDNFLKKNTNVTKDHKNFVLS